MIRLEPGAMLPICDGYHKALPGMDRANDPNRNIWRIARWALSGTSHPVALGSGHRRLFDVAPTSPLTVLAGVARKLQGVGNRQGNGPRHP